MAGFVDPAFKHLKLTEPNFLVWRISKLPEENYEAKEIRKEFWGNFFQEDSYIVFSSSPVKKPLGIGNREQTSKMEINIHFWLGSKLSEDDCRRTIIKAIEVDDVLEGGAVVHREIQGYESNRFLSYFKKGMRVMQGEITSVLRQGRAYSAAKLFELSERSSTLILNEYPSISWTFIDNESVVVLETKNNVFVWLGKNVTTQQKLLALKFESQRKTNGDDRTFVWMADGKEKDVPQEDLNDFEDFLSLRCKMVTEKPPRDFVLLHPKSRKDTELYKVISGEDGNTIIYVKDGPLLQSDLSAMDICLVHHYTSGVWVWVSKKVPEEERSRAINIGIAYLEKKPKSSYNDMSKMNVTRVVEGLEPSEFKLLFRSWSDPFLADGSGYFRKAGPRPVNMTLTADKLEDNPSLAAEIQLFDCGTGNMKILRLNGDNLEPLAPEQFGIFHASFSYIVHYSYTVRGKTNKIIYYWVGSNAPAHEKTNSIWSSLKDIPDLNDASVRIRIEQNHETPHFHAIFQGKILVLTRSILVSSSKKWSLDDYPIILFKIKGGDILNTSSTEVEPRASSLNSFNVFLMRTPKLSFIWCGKSSKGDEREIAKRIARKWTTEFSVILEGCENEEFWKLLGGFKCYSSLSEKTEPDMSIPPRAFKCSWLDNNFKAVEIVNFAQCDFASDEVIIFDAWKTVFVWTGRDVPPKQIFESENLVKAYLNTDPCDRNLSIPIIHVKQGREPAIFTGYFQSWDTSSTVTYDVAILKSFISEGSESAPAVEEEKVSAAIEEPSAEAPAEEIIYPVEMLQGKTLDELPGNVDPSRKEEYISEEDFVKVFGMTRNFFNKLPQWKRKNLKKSALLF